MDPKSFSEMRPITLEEAVKMWLHHRSDNILGLLLSGAATKPEVREVLDRIHDPSETPTRKGLRSEDRRRDLERRLNPIRKKAFHGNYREFFGSDETRGVSNEKFVLKKD